MSTDDLSYPKSIIAASLYIFLSLVSTQVGAADDPIEYTGSHICADCHQDQVTDWSGSDHGLAWTSASSGNLLGDFDNSQFDHDGVRYNFRTNFGGYEIEVLEKGGQRTTHPVHSVAGIKPLQQYLIETEGGRLQSFDVAWDVEKRQWFHLYPDQDLPPEDGLHWTGPYKNWNGRCAECHATNYQRNYGVRSGVYRSTTSEIGVGCESCHGPASKHIDWSDGASFEDTRLDAFGFISQPVTQAGELNQCAGCHSRREVLTNGTPPTGTDYHDAYNLALLRPGLYEADGQIRDEVYVYGSFLQSKMYAKGVSCTNCHDPHTAELKAEGNALCAQCHSPAGNPSFPSLRSAVYDDPAHTNHPEGSVGAQCKSCHMIERTYMGIDGRRDHSFRIPRPDLGAEMDSPDTCTDCHSDQSQTWAADHISNWFPNSTHRGPHFGQIFASARQNPVPVTGGLQEIARDTSQPGIVRATALYLLGPVQNPKLANETADLLMDADPLVRRSAAQIQQTAPVSDRISRLMPLLLNDHLSVRIAAAKQLLDVQPSDMSRSQQAILNAALRDWQSSLSTKLDAPETHLVLGGMALTMRNFPAAKSAFSTVVDLDPQRAEAWVMLVRLTQALDGIPAAQMTLDNALTKLPSHPQLLQLKTTMRE